MRVIRILAAVLFIVSVPVALVTSNIRFVVNEDRVYRYAIDEHNAVAVTGLARSELLRASAEIREYFRNDEPTLAINVRDDGRDVSLFNARETAHMEDVKDRFVLMNKAQELSTIYALGYIAVVVLWAREVSLRALAVQVAGGAMICVAAIAVVGIVSATGFDGAWENFHEIMFTNDFWLLNPSSDRLIQMFPPAFWENIVFFIGTMIIAEAVVLVLGALIYLGASRHRESRRLRLQFAG